MNELQSIAQLFEHRLFRIPDYQRGYAWRKDQLIDFWDDLMKLQPDRYHYTGLLSIKEVSSKEFRSWTNGQWLIESGYRPCHVVDGQQRLTTIVVLLHELLCLLKDLEIHRSKSEDEIVVGYDTLREMRAKYICRKRPPAGIITTYLFGYETDNPSADYLQYRVFNEPFGGTVEETYYTKNLKYAKQFFADNLSQLYAAEGPTGLELIYQKLTRKLLFNIHQISDDYDVFVAFETMNNRGKRLTHLELLKNRLIYLTTLYDDTRLDTADKAALRRKINDAWKEVYFQLGRNPQISLSDDEFLRAHWIMFFQYTRQRGDDYIQFLLNRFSAKNIFEKLAIPPKDDTMPEVEPAGDETDDSDMEELPVEIASISRLEPEAIDAYVMSLNEMAKYWYYTFFPYEGGFSQEEALWLDRLNRIGMGYFRPIVAAALSPSARGTARDRIRFLQEIERFIFLCFRLGGFMASYQSSFYSRKTKDIYTGVISLGEMADILKKTADGDAKTALGSFVNRMEKRFDSGEGFYGWHDLRYFLYEYEYQLARKNNLQKVDWTMFSRVEKDKVTIEHILPQTPTKLYWRNQFRMFTAEEVRILSGSLGNLLPLAQSINSGLQNDSFHDKKLSSSSGRRGYQNGSHSEIEVAAETDWNADEILRRGMRLLNFMKDRWSIPLVDESQMVELLHLQFLSAPREFMSELREAPIISDTPADTFGDPEEEPLSKTQELRQIFWNAFVEYCAATGRGQDIAVRKPSNKNYYDVPIGANGYHLLLNIAKKDLLQIGLYVHDSSAYARLEARKDMLEALCGFSMDWYVSPEKSSDKRVMLSYQTDLHRPENFAHCFAWLVDHIDRLTAALHTYDYEAFASQKLPKGNDRTAGEP